MTIKNRSGTIPASGRMLRDRHAAGDAYRHVIRHIVR